MPDAARWLEQMPRLVPSAERSCPVKLSLTATNGSTNAAPIAIRCLPPIRSIAQTAESRSYEKQRAIKKILHKEEEAMKHKGIKQIVSMLLAVVMLLSLMPVTTLTVFAAEKTEITEIKTVMSVDTVPKAGMEVTHFMPNVPDGEPYQRDWDGTDWYDSTGVKLLQLLTIITTSAMSLKQAAHTMPIMSILRMTATFFPKIPLSPFLALIPLCSNMRLLRDGTIVKELPYVISFTIPGEFVIPDINKVSMMYYGTVAVDAKNRMPVSDL